MVRLLCLLAGLISALGFGACTIPLAQREVLAGNDAFIRGDYQEATVHYLLAQRGNSEVQPWVNYNLGNVYHSLGETTIAMELWNAAAHSADPSLQFNIQFNRGIALFESGNYDDAYQAFRTSLELNPANMDAKYNLELTQKKMQAASVKSDDAQSPISPDGKGNADTVRLLDYIRNKEGNVWIPAAPHPETESANDW